MPDTLINSNVAENDDASLRNRFDIAKDIKSARLNPHIGAASRRLKAWVGSEAYADALSGAPANPLRKLDLENAEAALAMHFALPGLNSNVTVKGVAKTTKEGGALGGNLIYSYLTPNEVRQLSVMYLEQAEEIARPYTLADGSPEPEFQIVESDD